MYGNLICNLEVDWFQDLVQLYHKYESHIFLTHVLIPPHTPPPPPPPKSKEREKIQNKKAYNNSLILHPLNEEKIGTYDSIYGTSLA